MTGSCIEWLPAQVLNNKENLDITLRALDADGKQATWMKWELAFDGERREDAWVPTDSLPTTMEQAMLASQELISEISNAPWSPAARTRRLRVTKRCMTTSTQ